MEETDPTEKDKCCCEERHQQESPGNTGYKSPENHLNATVKDDDKHGDGHILIKEASLNFRMDILCF